MPIRAGSYGYLPGPGSVPHTNKLSFRDVVKSPQQYLKKVSLTKWMPPAYDQGQEGSCVYNAKKRLDQYSSFRSGGPNIMFSRQFSYYNGRDLQGTIMQDSGDYIHDAFHVDRFVGIIPESEWPYLPPDTNGNGGNMFTKPPQSCYDDAVKDQQHFYADITDGDVEAMKMCLMHSYPYEFGFKVPRIFEDPNFAKNPILDSSCFDTEDFVGGHGVCICGHDDDYPTPNDGPGAFELFNSWGTDWGFDGRFYMSYKVAAMTNICNDIFMERFLNQQTSLT